MMESSTTKLVDGGMCSPTPTISESTIIEATNTTKSPLPYKYRGFSTSISTLFHDPQDCCSIVYCGIFQWDYNYYLLKHKRPRTVGHILCLFVYIPLCILFTAVACHIFLDNDKDTQRLVVFIICNVLLVYAIILFLIELRKRIAFRRELFNLIREQHQLSTNQTDCDICCANLCFYRVDDNFKDDEHPLDHDFCTRLFRCFNWLCCGFLLKCWFQCFGSCAIAQEKREIQNLSNNQIYHIDYLSYEPYANYYPRIMKLRLNQNKNLFWHIGTLSKLSKSLFKMLLCACIGCFILAIFELTDDDFLFEFKDMGVFVMTFLQAFLILYFVHWKWNKFDLSYDAVVKYFAAGFILATFMAFFFESVLSIIIKLSISLVMLIFYPDELANERKLENEDYYDDNYDTTMYDDVSAASTTEDEEKNEFERNHPGLAIVMYFLNAFVVAALVEELSKYFAYSMVEHPDLIVGYNLEDDLKRQQSANATSTNNKGEVQVEGTNRNIHDTESLVNDYNDVSWAPEKNEIERQSAVSRPIINSSNDRSLNSIGAGITVAMVTVAIGFACCENLIYIFIYTQDTPAAEMTVLLARSIFPVHPLCAAIQSIGVCKQQLEKNSSYKLGSIISMPVFIHGLFDFSLMTVGVLVNSYGQDSLVVAFISFFVPLATVIFGFMFYFIEADSQVNRLNDLDGAIIAEELSNVIL